MGGIQSLHADPIKTINEVASHLLENCPTLKNFEAYMFGSSLHHVGADIDILIVGPVAEPLLQLKSEISFAGNELPLHVLYMDESELSETDFIARKKCVALAELVKSTVSRS